MFVEQSEMSSRVTPEMARAGLDAFYEAQEAVAEDAVAAIYVAMDDVRLLQQKEMNNGLLVAADGNDQSQKGG